MANGKQNGFTLIELMITMAIVAILAALAYPVLHPVHRSGPTARRRKAQMLDIANREQQFLLANRAYATKAQHWKPAGYALPTEPHGQVRLRHRGRTATAVPSFTVTFTAMGTQASDGPLTLNSEGVKGCGRLRPSTKW